MLDRSVGQLGRGVGAVTWERALAQLVGGIPRIERRTADLDLPVAVWRKLLVTSAARAGLDVQTFLVPWCPRSSEEADRQLVVIVLLGRLPTQHATGAPPDPSAERRGLPGWDAEDAQGASPPEICHRARHAHQEQVRPQ